MNDYFHHSYYWDDYVYEQAMVCDDEEEKEEYIKSYETYLKIDRAKQKKVDFKRLKNKEQSKMFLELENMIDEIGAFSSLMDRFVDVDFFEDALDGIEDNKVDYLCDFSYYAKYMISDYPESETSYYLQASYDDCVGNAQIYPEMSYEVHKKLDGSVVNHNEELADQFVSFIGRWIDWWNNLETYVNKCKKEHERYKYRSVSYKKQRLVNILGDIDI